MSDGQQYLDQYELQQCLRRDTTKEVWKAFDAQRHRDVILTRLHFTLSTDEAMYHFLRDTRKIIALHHPHLVSIFEVKVPSGTTAAVSSHREAYIVADSIMGLSLDQYLQMLSQVQKKLSPVEIIHILAPIASAIDYIHQHGVIHGLINPSAILLDKSSTIDSMLGEPKLAELGLHNTYHPHQLPSNEICYIAPEITQGYTDNIRSDLYSLGIILYEMCTGMLPCCDSTTGEIINQQVNMMLALPVLVNPMIEPELAAVMMRALAREPVARFPSASLMIDALAKALKVSLPPFSGQMNGQASLPDAMDSTIFSSSAPRILSAVPANDQELIASQSSVTQISASDPPISPLSTPSTSATYLASISNEQGISSVSGSYSAMADSTLQAQETINSGPVLVAQASVPVRTTFPLIKLKQRSLYTVFVILIVLALLIGSTWFLFTQPAAPQEPLVGHAFFVSSGLMDLTSARGITDGLQVHLENISAPQFEKSYYAWLLAGTTNELDASPVLLGKLVAHNSQAMLSYPGDANHNNLLSKYSHLLITEEDSSPQPVKPSHSISTWRYSAFFSRIPDPKDATNHFSLFDHLGHLLSQDPKIKHVGLIGGLDTWLYRNTLKILEWSGSARDLALAGGDTALIRRQLVRILDYLDSSQYVQTENLPHDLAANPVLTDNTIARVGLLEISPKQDPPGYLKHIAKHLYGITQSPGVTPQQKQLAREINGAIDNVQAWLTDLHKYAQELIHKPADQLIQPQTFPLFNALFELANNAFVSQTDPHTGQVKEAVAQIHYKIQSLATFDITAYPESKV